MLEQNTQYLVNTLLMQVSVTDIYFVYNFKRNLFLIKYTKLSSFICAKIYRVYLAFPTRCERDGWKIIKVSNYHYQKQTHQLQVDWIMKIRQNFLAQQ